MHIGWVLSSHVKSYIDFYLPKFKSIFEVTSKTPGSLAALPNTISSHMLIHVTICVCFVFALGYEALARKLAHFLSTNIPQLFVFRNLFSFPLHTYLVDIWPLMNGSNGDTRPPLHIGASRIVDFPSGTSSAEFLIASHRDFFSLRCGLALRLKKRFESRSTIGIQYCSYSRRP
jgi:hypothetical protein